MLSDDEYPLMEALQALDLLPRAETDAVPRFRQAMRCLADAENDLQNRELTLEQWDEAVQSAGNPPNLQRPTFGKKPLPRSMVGSLLRDQLDGLRSIVGDIPYIANVRVAVAIWEIGETVEAAKKDISVAESAPRRSEVRDRLKVLSEWGKELSRALKSPYVADALDRELSLGALPDERDKRRTRPITNLLLSQLHLGRRGPYKVLGHLVGVIALLANRALLRRVTLITEKGLEDGDLYYQDKGGRGSALSIDGLPLKQRFVVRCLKLFGQYKQQVASTVPDRPFAKFAKALWRLTTGNLDSDNEESLDAAIRKVFSLLRGKGANPAALAALLDLPSGTLPPPKSHR